MAKNIALLAKVLTVELQHCYEELTTDKPNVFIFSEVEFYEYYEKLTTKKLGDELTKVNMKLNDVIINLAGLELDMIVLTGETTVSFIKREISRKNQAMITHASDEDGASQANGHVQHEQSPPAHEQRQPTPPSQTHVQHEAPASQKPVNILQNPDKVAQQPSKPLKDNVNIEAQYQNGQIFIPPQEFQDTNDFGARGDSPQLQQQKMFGKFEKMEISCDKNGSSGCSSSNSSYKPQVSFPESPVENFYDSYEMPMTKPILSEQANKCNEELIKLGLQDLVDKDVILCKFANFLELAYTQRLFA